MTGRRWLVVGAGGMLGRDVVDVLARHGETVAGADRSVIDVVSPQSCRDAVAGFDVVVNCAAYTAVDAAESDEADAFAVNAVGAANVARAASAVGARTVHVSTDYVFDGEASSPYAEDAPPAPRTAYGRTKAAGEWAVRAEDPSSLVVRTAWLYGAHGRNFAATMLRLAGERETVSVVADQHGQPTWTVEVAEAIHRLVVGGADPGYWHASGDGETTWFGFARALFEGAGLDPERVRPTTSADYPLPAPRPAYSVLGKGRWGRSGIAQPRAWDVALAEALAGLAAPAT